MARPLPFALYVLDGNIPTTRIPFFGKVVTIGRGAECAVVIDLPDVSRIHANLNVLEKGLSLTHLSTTNDTLLNGKPVAGTVPLVDGDRITISDVSYLVRFEEARAASEDRDRPRAPPAAPPPPVERRKSVSFAPDTPASVTAFPTVEETPTSRPRALSVGDSTPQEQKPFPQPIVSSPPTGESGLPAFKTKSAFPELSFATALATLEKYEAQRNMLEQQQKEQEEKQCSVVAARLETMEVSIEQLRVIVAKKAEASRCYAELNMAEYDFGVTEEDSVKGAFKSLAALDKAQTEAMEDFATTLGGEVMATINASSDEIEKSAAILKADVARAVEAIKHARLEANNAYDTHHTVLTRTRVQREGAPLTPLGKRQSAKTLKAKKNVPPNADPFLSELKYRDTLVAVRAQHSSYEEAMRGVISGLRHMDERRVAALHRAIASFVGAQQQLFKTMHADVSGACLDVQKISAKRDFTALLEKIPHEDFMGRCPKFNVTPQLVRSGVLFRQHGTLRSTWKPHFCALTRAGFLHVYPVGVLQKDIKKYWETEESVKLVAYDVAACMQQKIVEAGLHCIELTAHTSTSFFALRGPRKLLFKVEEEEDMVDWIVALKNVLQEVTDAAAALEAMEAQALAQEAAAEILPTRRTT